MPKKRGRIENLTHFSKDHQPSDEARARGWAKRHKLKALGDAIISKSDRKKVVKKLAEYVGFEIDPNDISLAELLTLRQIEKALKTGDTIAYNAVMNRIVGPVNEQEIKPQEVNNTQINIGAIENMKLSERKKMEKSIIGLLKAGAN